MLFSALYDTHNDLFVSRMAGGGQEKVVEFWQAMEGHPQYQSHPLRRRRNHRQRCIPLGLHADGVPISGIGKSWGRSVDVISWCSLLCGAATAMSNFIVFYL
jgi:hypothetical protein